jgi:hypothetical protein
VQTLAIPRIRPTGGRPLETEHPKIKRNWFRLKGRMRRPSGRPPRRDRRDATAAPPPSSRSPVGTRYNSSRMFTLGANLAGEDMGRVADRVSQVIEKIGPPPQGVNVALRGQVVPMREMFSGLVNREIVVLEVNPSRGIEAAFAALLEQQAGALIIGNFTTFSLPQNRRAIIELAARNKIPAMYPSRLYPSFGGLMSYGADRDDYHRLGVQYVGQILKGTKPADLPVQQPIKFEFVINLKTAKALGIEVPPQLLAITDEVIE